MIRRPPRSTLFPTRRSSDLGVQALLGAQGGGLAVGAGKHQGAHQGRGAGQADQPVSLKDRKSTRLNSSHVRISYAVFCLKKKKYRTRDTQYSYNTSM